MWSTATSPPLIATAIYRTISTNGHEIYRLPLCYYLQPPNHHLLKRWFKMSNHGKHPTAMLQITMIICYFKQTCYVKIYKAIYQSADPFSHAINNGVLPVLLAKSKSHRLISVGGANVLRSPSWRAALELPGGQFSSNNSIIWTY